MTNSSNTLYIRVYDEVRVSWLTKVKINIKKVFAYIRRITCVINRQFRVSQFQTAPPVLAFSRIEIKSVAISRGRFFVI